MNTKLVGFGLGVSLVSLIAMTPANGAQEAANALNPRMFLPNVLSNRVPPTPSDWRIGFIIHNGRYYQDYLDHRHIMQINGDGTGLKKLVDLHLSQKNYAPTQRVFAWSPDGKYIAYLNENNLGLYDTDNRITKTLVANTNVSTFAWSPNSDSVSYVVGKSLIARYDLKTNVVTTITNDTTARTFLGYFDNFSQVPDFWRPGESLYSFSSDKDKITIIRSDGTNLTELRDGSHPTWSPTYDRLAYVRPPVVLSDTQRTISTTIGILTFDRATGIKSDVVLCSFADLDHVLMLNWSPDGENLLINVKAKDYPGDIYRIKTDGSQKTPDFIISGPSPIWTPDSRSIIYSYFYELYLLGLEKDSKPLSLTQHNFYMMYLTPASIAP
ncbi:MAG: PD40 domain-containing protein [Anaerolineae bacterium]|nr:PD40 domain-containing protein [Anaerolineae bacterium]